MDNELRIVQGNTFATAIEINAVDATGQPIVDWSLQDSTDIRVWYVFAGREQDITTWQIDDGKLVIVWLANMQRVGTYDIFCAGKYNGADWRNAMQYQFRIVRFNHEAHIPANVVILDGIYQLSAELQIITQFEGGGGGTPSTTLPLMDGEAAVGTENAYARGDHRHPSDTSKQDTIADLATIRSGAAAGATAYQKPTNGIPKNDLASGVQASLGKADTALQTETEPLFTASAAAGITSEDITEWDNKSDFSGNYNDLTNKPTIPAAQVNSDWNAGSGVAQILNKPTIPAAQVQSDWNEADNTKADYIKNKPTIPAAQVQSDWNEADNTKADYIKNKPTIPSVVDALNSASTSSALSANQGKVLNESKQDKIDNSHKLSADLVDDASTTNKFVTASEKSTWNGKANKVLVNNHGTDDTTYSVTPNVLHIWGTVASLTLTLATPTDATIVNEYMIEFTSGSTATTLSLPSSVEWAESCGALSVEASKTYQISIVNNIGLWTAISNS